MSGLLGSEILSVTPLGAGNEVGRSCIIVKFKGRTIMLDCGIHPAFTGLASLPFFDEIDPATVDLVLITHFHLDHAAALPYFLEKTAFKGKVYMTHPTKAIYKWLLSDFVRMTTVAIHSQGSSMTAEDQLYDDKDLARSFDKISTVDYHQEIDIQGIKFTAFNAGHVLGAAMFLIEIAGVCLLYTGDYSREEDRHLMAAETPPVRPQVMVCESTYGVSTHMPREERERRFTGLVHEIVGRGGRCLVPIFALGRAQELMLILDEYWQRHPELHKVPIYYVSALAKKCLAVYQTYLNMMNERIRRQTAVKSPFLFEHVQNLKTSKSFVDSGPCVVLASPAQLQSGFSRELLEAWAPHRQNGVIIPGYVVDGTMAKHILTEPESIQSLTGYQLPLRMTIAYISFSAHVDFAQNSEFIDVVHPRHLVLVHGEHTEMMRLKSALQHRYEHEEVEDRKMTIHTPRNCESVSLPFQVEKSVKIVGQLASRNVTVGEGILVGKDFDYQLVHPDDLEHVTGLHRVSIRQSLHVASGATLSLLVFHMQGLFGPDQVVVKDDSVIIISGDKYTITQGSDRKHYVVQWQGDPVSDILADSIVALIMAAESARSSVKFITQQHQGSHSHHHQHQGDELKEGFRPSTILAIQRYLEEFYGALEETTLSDVDDTPCYQFHMSGIPFKVTMEQAKLIVPEGLSMEKNTIVAGIRERLQQLQRIIFPDVVL
jgi:cleavage and polyadenylation specificity factor subunit 3